MAVKGMSVQSQMIERTARKSRREPTSVVLLKTAETKLRAGHVSDALKLFRAIVNRYPPSLERLAALSYLQA